MTETSSNPALLEMLEVTVGSIYSSEITLIEKVNWKVFPGQYWVVAGPPASGKTDLLATAAGLVRPRAGGHRLLGEDLAQLPEDDRLRVQVRVGFVFGHGGRLFNHLTVAENLALPLCYHSNCVAADVEQRVKAILETMELGDVRHSKPASINRSLRQRVALARALVLAPDLLFLDNPLAGVDPREARWWLNFLGTISEGHPLIKGHKVTLVVGTEDLEQWKEQSCQYGVIQARQFLGFASKEELIRHRHELLPELLPSDWLKG